MKKFPFFCAPLFLIIICNSCSVNKSVIGLYGKCEKGYFACTQIELKADKTFEYFIFMDVGGASIVRGSWDQVSRDSIQLNTFKQPVNPFTTYEGKITPTLTKKIKITLEDWETPLPFAYVNVNDKNEGKLTDENGIVEIEEDTIKTITYQFLSREEKIEIDNPDFNELIITVRDLEMGVVPKYLTDKILVKKRNRLFFNYEYSLKKTNLKYKQWK